MAQLIMEQRDHTTIVRKEAPLSPIAGTCGHPKVGIITTYAIGVKNPINVDVLKHELSNSIMVKLPRFSSLLVQDPKGRRQRWVPTDLDLDKHIIVVNHRHSSCKDEGGGRGEGMELDKKEADEIINEYIAGFTVSSPMDNDKPLWELHVLVEVRCLIFRFHHAIGDGTSLMSLVRALGRKDHQQHGGGGGGGDNQDIGISTSNNNGRRMERKSFRKSFVDMMSTGRRNLRGLWFGMVFSAQRLAKSTWLKDDKTVISGAGRGVELCPRKLVTLSFSLDDMKMIKTSIPNATINDVLIGVIWYGLSKYLHLQSPQIQKRLQITGLCMVNVRKERGLQEISTMMKEKSKARWGNKFGICLLPLYYHLNNEGNCKEDPIDYLKRAKLMMDQKKQSKEAHSAYKTSRLIVSCLGSNAGARAFNRLCSNTTFLISNNAGPSEEIALFGNPVTFIRVNGYAIPQAIKMHMVSYAGMANLQILVAKDIIPDPQLLSKCFEDAFKEMKTTVLSTGNTK